MQPEPFNVDEVKNLFVDWLACQTSNLSRGQHQSQDKSKKLIVSCLTGQKAAMQPESFNVDEVKNLFVDWLACQTSNLSRGQHQSQAN